MSQLTSNTGETTLGDLLGADNIYSIPYFQRPYKWNKERITQFSSDLLALVDEATDAHFLGAVILHQVPADPADPNVYEIIDGQQRLTTAYLYLCAAVDALARNDGKDDAAALFKRYLVITGGSGNLSNLALHTGKDDRSSLNTVLQELNVTGDFGFDLKPLRHGSDLGGPESRVLKNYRLVRTFLREQVEQSGVEQVKKIYAALLQGMRVIQITVKDPTNGPKIFDSLNSRQQPVTIGDLVRNDIFSRGDVGDPHEIETIEQENWRPFYAKFRRDAKDYFDAFFFPFGLVHDPNLQKSDVYNSLRRSWAGKSPQEVIDALADFQGDFMDLVTGENTCQHESPVALRFNRLYRSGIPGSTLPFLMRLSNEVSKKRGSNDVACEILDSVESFLVRRAVCGIEPTGLHAVFKGAWADLGDDISVASFRRAVSNHVTVEWPTDEKFADAVRNRALYRAAICRYVIAELDAFTTGDTVADPFTIEHVLPQTYSERDPAFVAGWGHFTKEDHARVANTLPNLIPISPSMNSGLGQSDYATKQAEYLLGSRYASARRFGTSHATWTLTDLESRADYVAAEALRRWPDAGA